MSMANMYKSFLTIVVLLTLPAFGQPASKDSIKHSESYYYGEGTAENEQEASDGALGLLTKQIAATVSSQFERTQFETNDSYTDQVTSVVKSFSSATLRNVRSISSHINGKINVFHYIKRSEVEHHINQDNCC